GGGHPDPRRAAAGGWALPARVPAQGPLRRAVERRPSPPRRHPRRVDRRGPLRVRPGGCWLPAGRVTMEQRCLLAAFAHPDDEAFGTAGVFRKYRDEGARTALVCATRGEEGEISDPALATPETLGKVREQELREACRIIGVEDLSFLDYRDGSLAQVDPR